MLDAICFVLGITNLSQVRAGSLQDLVYKQVRLLRRSRRAKPALRSAARGCPTPPPPLFSLAIFFSRCAGPGRRDQGDCVDRL